jgi:uncharacterized protein involved in tolerance to divalent cations
MTEVCEVVITAPDAEWLAGFTRRLVEDRLCASGHNIASIRSIYRWRGQIYDKSEARVALHTPGEPGRRDHRADQQGAPLRGAVRDCPTRG